MTIAIHDVEAACERLEKAGAQQPVMLALSQMPLDETLWDQPAPKGWHLCEFSQGVSGDLHLTYCVDVGGMTPLEIARKHGLGMGRRLRTEKPPKRCESSVVRQLRPDWETWARHVSRWKKVSAK